MFHLCLLLIFSSLTFYHNNGNASCKCNSEKILENKIPYDNHRYRTFAIALDLLSDRKAAIIVETGTSRYGLSNCLGDGCSTIIFAEWARNNGGKLYSVDINAINLQNAAEALGDLRPIVHLVHSDSIEFLKNFNQPIDFLYLDSYDLDFF